ncbi:MAG: hypothetical protein AB1671_09390 [Thermodesulfobacteriota bacterium]|jgi:hypothetical protein
MLTVLALYEKLKPKLGEEETRVLLEFVEASVERKAATKEDLQRTESALKADLQHTALTFREELQRTEVSLRAEIHRLDQKIAATKADLIKRTFGFRVGNVAVLSGIIFALLRAFVEK